MRRGTTQLDSSDTILAQISALTNMVKNLQKQPGIHEVKLRQDYQQPNNYRTLENTLNTFMTPTSAYMAKTDKFIQKTDAFMDRTEMRMQNQEAALKSLENQVISTRSGKVLNPPTENRKGEITVANSKAASDTDIAASVDTPASADKDHNIPPEPKEAEITSATPQPRRDILEEQRPPPPFPQRLRKQKQ
ncbi:hypothetical protein V6N13_008069 [Hibiscus sabdariffa]